MMIAGAPAFQGAGPVDFSSLAGLQSGFNNASQAALQFNQGNYNAILGGFQQAMAQQQAGQNRVNANYGTLIRGVLGSLRGANQSNLQDIHNQYVSASGDLAQQMVARGLGNTTVQGSMQRGLESGYAQEKTRSNNAFANLLAQYRSQLGMARLGYQGQSVQDQTALATNQLGWMNSVSAPYPDMGAYAAAAQALGGAGGMATMPMASVPGPQVGYSGYTMPQSSVFYS